MSKIYTYEIIKDTDLQQIYWEEFWDNDFHYIAKQQDIDGYIREKDKIDKEYFVFAFDKHPFGYYRVSKTKNNGVEVVSEDEYGEYTTDSGVYALRKSDFDNDLEKAFEFAKGEIDYLNELEDSYFNEIRFSAYEYDQEKQKYVETDDYFINKSIQAYELEEIMLEKDLTLKEKLINVARNNNILDGDKLDEYDFLQDPNSIVMSEKALLLLPKELHSFIDKGLTQQEKEKEQRIEKLFLDHLKTLTEMYHKETKFFIKEKPLNSQDYWVVEFNEAFPEEGVKDYKGKIVTKELVDELKELDERVHKSNPVWAKEEENGEITLVEIPLFKFYFNHIKNEEVIDYYKVLIGYGNQENEPEFQFLYEQVEQERKQEQDTEQQKEREQEPEEQVQKRAKRLRM